MDNYKNCPFCKELIPKDSISCPNCTRVLIEKITVKRYENIDIPSKQERKTKKRFIPNIDIKKSAGKYIFPAIFLLILFFSQIYKTSTPQTQQTCEDIKNEKSLRNGTFIKKIQFNEENRGELKIENGTQFDALAKMVNSYTNESIYIVYITANNNLIINQIPDGKYILLFSLGKNWNTTSNKFATCSSFARFVEEFNYKTIPKYDGIEYTTFRISLHPVVGGKAKTDEIAETDFNKY